MKKRLFVVIALVIFVCGTLVSAGSILKTIKVNFDLVKTISLDGQNIEVNDYKPMVYNGMVYLSVDTVGKIMGRSAKWNRKTSILEFSEPIVTPIYLTDIGPCSSDIVYSKGIKMQVGGTKYEKGLSLKPEFTKDQSIYWNLDGQYSTVSGFIGIEDNRGYFGPWASPAKIEFYVDDELVGSVEVSEYILGKPFSVDVKDGIKFQLKIVGKSINHDSSSDKPYLDLVNVILK